MVTHYHYPYRGVYIWRMPNENRLKKCKKQQKKPLRDLTSIVLAVYVSRTITYHSDCTWESYAI